MKLSVFLKLDTLRENGLLFDSKVVLPFREYMLHQIDPDFSNQKSNTISLVHYEWRYIQCSGKFVGILECYGIKVGANLPLANDLLVPVSRTFGRVCHRKETFEDVFLHRHLHRNLLSVRGPPLFRTNLVLHSVQQHVQAFSRFIAQIGGAH